MSNTNTNTEQPDQNLIGKCLPIMLSAFKQVDGALKLHLTKAQTVQTDSLIKVLVELKSTLLEVRALTLISSVTCEHVLAILPNEAKAQVEARILAEVTEMATHMKNMPKPAVQPPPKPEGIWVPKL